jgi:hypothetical protein
VLHYLSSGQFQRDEEHAAPAGAEAAVVPEPAIPPAH